MDYTTFLTPSLGIGGIVLLAVIMLMRGDLVSRKQVDALLVAKNEQIELYKTAYDKSEKAHGEKDKLLAALMDTARTTRSVLDAVSQAAGQNEGSPHDSA